MRSVTSDPIERFLAQEGPKLSTDVTAHLCSVLGISEAAARQRVSRAKYPVKRLGLITFPKRARFLYLEQQFGSPYYWRNLKAALSKNNTAYGYALTALLVRDGVCLEKYFPIICGSPTRQKGHLSSAVVMDRMLQAGLLKRERYDGLDLITLARNEGEVGYSAEQLFGLIAAESILLDAIKGWLQKLNFVSYNSVRTRDDDVLPMVATYPWDLSAPSYLHPLLGGKSADGVKPGFWVCDVLLGSVSQQCAEVFLRKIQTFRSLRTVAPTVHMIVAEQYTGTAFKLLKSSGVVVATVKTLFGLGAAEALRKTAIALSDSLRGKVDAEELASVLNEMEAFQGNVGNLRGVFFELLIRDVVRATSVGSPVIYLGFSARISKTIEADVDVLTYGPNSDLRCIEAKAYNPRHTLSDDEVDRWITHNIPTVYKYIQGHPEWRKSKITFEMWTTAPLTSNAMSKVEAFQLKNSKRYSVIVKQADEVSAEFKLAKDKKLIQLLKQHFLKDRPDQT